MRAKWSAPIRKYWKISEQMMVKYCDLAICDSVNIEKYIHECYDGKGIQGSSPKTTFIAYGADLTLSKLADDDEKLMNWYREKGLTKKDYYLVVGRFVPENSFEVMIREFMKSKSKKNFAIITNVCFRRIIENRPRPKNEPMVDGKCGFLFLDQNGNPTVAMHWEHYFNHICTSYNKLYREQLPNITPHVCRHTFCSNMAKSGMNPKTLQYLMGHSDIGVTLNTYTHVQYDDVETEMKRVVNAE